MEIKYYKSKLWREHGKRLWKVQFHEKKIVERVIFHVSSQYKNLDATKEMIRFTKKEMLFPHNFLIEVWNSLSQDVVEATA